MDVNAVLDQELLSLHEFVSDDILTSLLSNPISELVYNQTHEAVPLPPTSEPLPPVPTSASSEPLPPVPTPPTREPLPPTTSNRFASQLSECQLKEAINGRIPTNTKNSTNWGITVWKDWCKARSIETPIEQMVADDINTYMAHFVQEARRRDGAEYPVKSLHNIVSSIQRFLRENGRADVFFYDEKNTTLRKSLDAKMKELTRNGIGLKKKQAQPITMEMESTLWEKEIFNRDTAKGLPNIVFWYASKMFRLRAADEHRTLDVEQFSIETDENNEQYLRFSGRACKNYQGGLHHMKVEAKDLKIYADNSREERCIMSCFKYYLTLIPATGPFYRRPIGDNPPRYSVQSVGVNTLKKIVKNFCAEAGFIGQYSNHSGKVTCATELFQHNIDEQLIMKQTGHRSQDAVRTYKRPATEHTKQVSEYLQPPRPKRLQVTPVQQNVQLSQNTSNISLNTSKSPKIPFNSSSSGNSVQNIYISMH